MNDRALEHSTEWGLRDMLEHLFQQTPWLHATTYSLDKCDTHGDTHDDTSYFAEIIRYFREELILTFLLCWYQRNHVGFRSEKRISPQSLDDAFDILICFPVCLMYLSEAGVQGGNTYGSIGECLRSSMVANVYLDVVDICLHNHANNPRLGEFLRIFYGTVVEDMILLSGTNQSTGATNVLQFDLKLRAMSIVLNHFCTFTKGTDATINLAQKEQRDKFESAVIKVIESAVSLSQTVGAS